MKYRIKNWKEFQHYKDRNPPWIKLHFALLSSKDWVTLDDKSRVLAVASMLIGSKSEGEIDGSEAGLAYLQRVAYLHTKPNLKPLIDCGFLESASGMLADASAMQANARPEERRDREETETETEKKNTRSLPLPDWLPVESWQAWLQIRPKVKAPNTPHALRIALSELGKLRDAGHDPKAVLDCAVTRGWRGLFPPSAQVGSQPDYSQVIANLRD